LITNQGYSFAEAGRNLGVNPNVLSRWKKEIEPVASSSQAAKRQIPCNGLCKISHGKYPDHKSKKLDY
jgi:transposase-like protein